jgi:hypothetical protein
VFRNRYLLMLAFMPLLNNRVNSDGEHILGRIVREAAVLQGRGPDGLHGDAFIAGFYVRYFAVVNIVGMLLQLLVVSRVILSLRLGQRFRDLVPVAPGARR